MEFSNYTLKVSNLIKYFLLLILVYYGSLSCKKDKESEEMKSDDYRSGYVGDFQFTICTTDWWMTPDSICWTKDTILTNGIITLYHTDKILIKYYSGHISGIWRGDTMKCDGYMICTIADSLINNPPSFNGSYFMGYFDNWVSPVLHKDSTLEVPCVPFRLSGGVHLAFGGYFINRDSLYLFYSSGGLGFGTYRYIYGSRK